MDAFEDSGDHNLLKRRVRMRDCATKTFILASAKGARLTVNHCDDRACAPCANHRTRRVFEKFEKVSAGKSLRFMTLTQASRVGETLADARKRLRADERKFRQRKAWKEHVTGGLRSEEVTWSNGAWHVHFHYMTEGRYWPQDELAAQWGGIADIRAAYDVRELLKYSLKTAGVPAYQVAEWAIEMERVREVEFLGSWRGKQPDVDAQEEATTEELDAFRYVCEEPTLERGDHRIVTEARLSFVGFVDYDAPPAVASWARDRMKECFNSLCALRERIGPDPNRLAKYP
jgi:hypothetical protein